MAGVARKLGRPFMPHQQLVADVAGEVLDDGRMAYPIVVLLLPRRGGKTALLLPTMLQRSVAIERARCWYTAQTGGMAGMVFREEWVDLVENSTLRRHITTRLSNGSESMRYKRSRIGVFAPTEKALHSQDADVAAIDEAWAFSDLKGTQLEQAIRPAQATRRRRQLWIVSAGGSEDVSTWLLRWRALGRELVGPDQGVAYFEWHPPVVRDEQRGWILDPAVDLDDPAVWLDTHPAAGRTIDLDFLKSERSSMGAGEFRRAYLNVFSTTMAPRLLPEEWWNACRDENSALPQERGLSLAYDVAEDRGAGAIGLARQELDELGRRVRRVELVAYDRGTDWMAGAVESLRMRLGCDVAADGFGPASTVTRDLTDRGVSVHEIDTRELVDASAECYDDVRDGVWIHRGQGPLDIAAEFSEKRQLGDAWAFVRKRAQEDVSPLFATAIAAHRARHTVNRRPEIVLSHS